MKKTALLFCLVFSAFSFSQTKLISHKSHSGSDATFRIALENNLFDIGDSNLGAAPDRYERNAHLDSVIYVSKNKTILVTSEHCISSDRYDHRIIDKSVWKPGREIVAYNSLFSKNHSLDSIKKVLKEEYNFRNDIDKTVFVGFDNGQKPIEKSKRKKKSWIPVFTDNSDFPSKPFLILVLTLLSSIVAFFTWKTTKFKTVVSN